LGTNVAYGVNWVFGDTLANYVAGMEGFVVIDPMVAAVPEPATFALVGLAIGGCTMVRRRRAG
jgi:hypothetical protein